MGVHFRYGDVVVKRGAGLEPRNQDGKAVRPPVFAAKAERMHIDASLWARVCDQVASGEAKYGHLLLLQRVVVEDLEAIYEALNEAGELLGSDDVRGSVVGEARRAFSHNVDVYKEEGALVYDGIRGLSNIVIGYMGSRAGRR